MSLKLFLQEAVREQNPISGAVIAIQTFGDFLGFNPHCHVLVTDGCFYGNGIFRVAPHLDLKRLEAIFRHKAFKMLLAKGRITKDLIAMLSNWRHSGFQVFCGNRISPKDETAMENLARLILRAAFSQERELYLAEPSKVVYRAKDGTEERSSMPWNGWPLCAPTSRTGGSPADGGSTVLWVLQSRVSRDLPGKTERKQRGWGWLYPGSR